MASATITFRVDDAERNELVNRAKRDNVTLSDYIRVRLGLRGQGPTEDGELDADPQQSAVMEQVANHEKRLRALEAARP